MFFDLVVVFAFGQLIEHPHGQLSWRGAGETAVALVAALNFWALTSSDATFLDVERSTARRWVLVVVGVGFMNTQIPHAVADHPWAFALPLVTVLLLVDLTAAVRARTPVLRHHYRTRCGAAVTVNTAVTTYARRPSHLLEGPSEFCCALGRIRTCNLLIRSQVLYPLSYERLLPGVFLPGRLCGNNIT